MALQNGTKIGAELRRSQVEYKFVENSVCPPMAEALGRHLLGLLKG